jgi:hypothetical protein
MIVRPACGLVPHAVGRSNRMKNRMKNPTRGVAGVGSVGSIFARDLVRRHRRRSVLLLVVTTELEALGGHHLVGEVRFAA